MGINFPASPTVGQKYPQPAVAGIPVYTWDGEKWTTVGGSIAAYAPPSTILPLMDATPAVTGVGTAYTREDHVHPTDTTRAALAYVDSADANRVRWDAAQSLTAPQQQQARQNIYAAPFDAVAYSGLQINGGMEVSQERGTAGTTTSNSYVCDGWRIAFVGTMAISCTIAASPQFTGFPYLSYFVVPTAQASLGVGDFTAYVHAIEGYRIARLAWGSANAQSITIGFWTAHHRTGLYSGTIRNGAGNRSYAFTYTQNIADASQYNVVTVPGDTTGTWATDNTTGMYVMFAAGCGSTFTAPSANTWVAGSFYAAPGQINAVAATTDACRITGLIILPGNEAPSAARSPFVMRPYDQELLTCKRYYYKRTIHLVGYAAAGQLVGQYYPHPVSMRAAPACSTTGGTLTNTAATPSPNNVDADGFRLFGNATASGTMGIDNILNISDARL